MATSDKINAVHRYLEAFDKGDLEIIKAIYAPNARVEDPVGSAPHEGIDAVCSFYEGALASGAKLQLTGPPRCAGNAVAFPFQAVMPGVVIDIIDVFEFNHEGQIISMRAYWGPENFSQ